MDALPLFLTLAGKRVIIIGDGEAGDAKARLVEAAGGIVTADETGDARIAFVALDDEAAARAAADRLRARGLLVNVVDRPGLSDFTMGAIVDRSPVIVAIASGGASASLSRALRERLEALLPDGLGRLADAIRAARDAAAARHPTIPARRRLWARAMATGGRLDPLSGIADPTAAVAAVIADETPAEPTRTVAIAIASDDPGDLTLNQLALLGRCDALAVGPGVAPAIADRARRDATRLGPDDPAPAGLTVRLMRG